jgi:hypothetical protein
MENMIVSTTYVPLQPPYQIIKYKKDIAMQIGTLIASTKKEDIKGKNGYKIETHSHPVVVYENKNRVNPSKSLVYSSFLEGAVWNNVEVKDVTTICLSNSRLPWSEFLDFLWYEVRKLRTIVLPTLGSIWLIDKLCDGVELPKAQPYVVHLEKKYYPDGKSFISSQIDDIIVLKSSASDETKMKKEIFRQLQNYRMILLSKGDKNKKFQITYETDEASYRNLVDELNSQSIYTHLMTL